MFMISDSEGQEKKSKLAAEGGGAVEKRSYPYIDPPGGTADRQGEANATCPLAAAVNRLRRHRRKRPPTLR
jgi:hypothetical protein